MHPASARAACGVRWCPPSGAASSRAPLSRTAIRISGRGWRQIRNPAERSRSATCRNYSVPGPTNACADSGTVPGNADGLVRVTRKHMDPSLHGLRNTFRKPLRMLQGKHVRYYQRNRHAPTTQLRQCGLQFRGSVATEIQAEENDPPAGAGTADRNLGRRHANPGVARGTNAPGRSRPWLLSRQARCTRSRGGASNNSDSQLRVTRWTPAPRSSRASSVTSTR